MSLINEALKKARKAQPAGPATATAAGPALQPAEAGGRAHNSSIFTLPFVIALALMLAGIMLWAWSRAGKVELVVRANTDPTAVNATPYAVAPTPVAASSPTAATPVVAARTDIVFTNAVARLDPLKAPAPAYHLDGLFFRPNRPAAVINGQMVYVGSRLEEARVTAIDQESATIVTSSGQTNVLVLAN